MNRDNNKSQIEGGISTQSIFHVDDETDRVMYNVTASVLITMKNRIDNFALVNLSTKTK